MVDEEIFGRVADLLRVRNTVDERLAALVGRPALTGHLGVWIAAQVFGIELDAAADKAVDGRFAEGPLAGKTVGVKWSLRREGMVDMAKSGGPDFYLVLTGPKAAAATSREDTRPLVVDNVYLFPGLELEADLRSRGLAVGTASSVRAQLWTAAEIYPRSNGLLPLTDRQRQLLGLLSSR